MKWSDMYKQLTAPYLADPVQKQTCVLLSEAVEGLVPDGIMQPVIFGDSESMDLAWHYQGQGLSVHVEFSVSPDGSGDIYIWDESHQNSVMGEIGDPVYRNMAREYLSRILADKLISSR
jgi:hypothetical protein